MMGYPYYVCTNPDCKFASNSAIQATKHLEEHYDDHIRVEDDDPYSEDYSGDRGGEDYLDE